MFSKLTPYFKIQMRICNIFFLTPYEWPEDSSFPIVHRKKWKQNLYTLTLFAQWMYVIMMTINFVFTLSRNNTASKMLGIVFLDCFICTMSLRTVFFMKEKEGLNMISSFLEFEKENPEVKTAKPNVMGRCLMVLGMLTSFGLPATMAAILFADPCKPPHLGYMLLKTAEECRNPGFFGGIGLLMFDYFMWMNSIAPACYYVFEYMFVGLKCMDWYLQIITNNLSCSSKQNSTVTKTGRFIFVEPQHVYVFRIYRQVQLLNKKYDEVLQAVFYPSIIFTALSAIIISLYTCLKLHHLIPMPGLAFFPLLAMDGSSVIFIVKVAGGVLMRSNIFLEALKNNTNYKKRTLFKKITRSMGKIKVRFGSTNFIDQLTPFVFIDFCLTNTVNLMLIT